MSADVMAWAASQPEGSQARALYNAIVTGALVVRNANGESVTYRSASDMLSVLSYMRGAATVSSLRRPRVTIARVGEPQ